MLKKTETEETISFFYHIFIIRGILIGAPFPAYAYDTQLRLHTISLDVERQPRKLWIPAFTVCVLTRVAIRSNVARTVQILKPCLIYFTVLS